MKYPKMQTLWKRDENNKYVIMPGEYSKEEFRNILQWHVTEKIDGTNIRVFITFMGDGSTEVRFGGRTEKAQIPTHLLDALQDIFTEKNVKVLDGPDGATEFILFGEGYGPKIQKGGGLYRDNPGFILFDVWCGGWWLDRLSVEDIANKLGIKTVPTIGICSVGEIIELVKEHHNSEEAEKEKVMEGVVARSYPLMLFRDGTPIMFKLKCEDFDKLKRFTS